MKNNNTSKSVPSKSIIILTSLLLILSTFFLLADSYEEYDYPQERVEPGDPVPTFKFTDVFDKEDSNDYNDDWFFLYCFAKVIRKRNNTNSVPMTTAGIIGLNSDICFLLFFQSHLF